MNQLPCHDDIGDHTVVQAATQSLSLRDPTRRVLQELRLTLLKRSTP
jgi:hypothetical protein